MKQLIECITCGSSPEDVFNLIWKDRKGTVHENPTIHPILKPKDMTLDELRQAVVDCYRTFYMGKLTQIENIKDTVKRDYLIYTMKVMFESSFIKDFSHKLGKIPEEVQRFMEKYLGKPSTAL